MLIYKQKSCYDEAFLLYFGNIHFFDLDNNKNKVESKLLGNSLYTNKKG